MVIVRGVGVWGDRGVEGGGGVGVSRHHKTYRTFFFVSYAYNRKVWT